MRYKWETGFSTGFSSILNKKRRCAIEGKEVKAMEFE